MCGKDVRNGNFAAGASGVGSLNEYNYLAMLWLPGLLMENNLAILAALFDPVFKATPAKRSNNPDSTCS